MHIQATKIIKAGLLVGTLDITAAFLYYFIKTNKNPLNILLYIASAVFGKDATTGGAGMIAVGLLFHYVIAFTFTLFFFWLYARTKIQSANPILVGVFYGLLIWCIMNLLVVPSTKIGWRPFNFTNAVINAAILIVCIGSPLSYMASAHHQQLAKPAAA